MSTPLKPFTAHDAQTTTSAPALHVITVCADQIAPQPWRNGGGQTKELLVWPSPEYDRAKEAAGKQPASSLGGRTIDEAAGNTPPGSLGGTAFCAGKGGARAAGGGHGAERSATQTPSANQPSSNATTWHLRISRADITASGPFSAFDGIDRWFIVLSGNGVILHMPTADGHTRDHSLLPGHTPLHFDGALAPGCTLINGPTQDFNLMARGGTACVVPTEPNTPWQTTTAMCGLYTCTPGTWRCGSQQHSLPAHTLLWLPEAPDQPMLWQPSPTTTTTEEAAPTSASAPHPTPSAAPAQAWWLGYTPQNA